MAYGDTLNPLIRKFDDYLSEEYIKTLVTASRPDRKLQSVNPYVGVISYPSDDFLSHDAQYVKLVQFQNTTYVGHMEFLLPPDIAQSNVGTAYTLLSFNLDGKVRRFVQISSGETTSKGVQFKDFVLGKFPDANSEIAYTRQGIHILSDIEISGGLYLPTNDDIAFSLLTSGNGVYTPSIQFEIGVSGYKTILQ